MFAKLFAESGLSLDRLKALLEVGSAGSITKAAMGDPVRQSQYSRQIKELEDFFRTKLIERQGKGTRLTARGKELALISRFFLLGLSNFQRGCLAEEQVFRIGAGTTFISQFLLPKLCSPALQKAGPRYATEALADVEIEHRLHDLTLDFGIVTTATLSRPLKTIPLSKWQLELWVPLSLRLNETKAAAAFKSQQLPLILAVKELKGSGVAQDYKPHLACDNFLEAKTLLEHQPVAALLPDFLAPDKNSKTHFQVPLPKNERIFHFYLAWNPRLLRLNAHANRMRNLLADSLRLATGT